MTSSVILKQSLRKQVLPMQGNNSVWMLSFGDLLTLLFCFFLMLVSSGSLSLGRPSVIGPTPGTTLAREVDEPRSASEVRQYPSPVYLSAEDLTEITSLRARIRDMMPSDTHLTVLRIMSCRSPYSAAFTADLRNMVSATDGLGILRIYGLHETPCPTTGQTPPVMSITFEAQTPLPQPHEFHEDLMP